MKVISCCILIALASISKAYPQDNSSEYSTRLVALLVSDIEQSVTWYESNLGFVKETSITDYPTYKMKIAMLERDGFRLEIIEKETSMDVSNSLNDGEYLSGYLKLGIKTSELDTLYSELKSSQEVNFLTGIGDIPKPSFDLSWPSRYFLITDPDGNMIQFFSEDEQSNPEFQGWLSMITVSDIEEISEWYQIVLGFELLETVGVPGNRRAILSQGESIVELFEPSEVVNELQGVDEDVRGIKKIAFGVTDFDRILSQISDHQIEVVVGPNESSTDWATRFIIIKDPAGNWLQFFEVDAE